MTFNLFARNRHADGVLSSILAARADVVAVQELADQMAIELARGLSHTHPHQSLYPTGVSGGGVFSRYPIVADRTLLLSEASNVCQHLAVELPGNQLHLFNVHLNAPNLRRLPFRYDNRLRRLEAAKLVDEVTAAAGPLVVAGDFNMTPRSETYALIASALADAIPSSGSGYFRTFPNPGCKRFPGIPSWLLPFPLIRIDYVFHSTEVECLSVKRGNGDGSDHCPVIATLRF